MNGSLTDALQAVASRTDAFLDRFLAYDPGCRAARPGRQADPGRHPSPEALPRARPAAVARGQRPVNPLLPVSPLGAPVR